MSNVQVIAIAFGVTITSPLALVLAVIIGSVCFATMSLLFSVAPVSGPQYSPMLSTLIKFPLLFISGVFVPLRNLPTVARAISFISPLTYFTDIARYATGHESYLLILVDFGAITAFTVVLRIIAVKLHNKTLPMRV